MLKNYKHIFFDLDHTLWDYDTNAKETLQLLFFENKLDQLTDAPFDIFWSWFLHYNALFWKRYENNQIGMNELKWKRFWRALLEIKIPDELLAKKLSAEFLDILPTKAHLFDGALFVIEQLHNRYPLHIITNGFEEVQLKKLKNSGLYPYFTQIITSEKSGFLKPRVEMYQYALSRASAIATESVMVGDHLVNDIGGSKAAGLLPIYINHVNKSAPTEVKTIFHLKELLVHI